MKESIFKSYAELPLLLKAATVARSPSTPTFCI